MMIIIMTMIIYNSWKNNKYLKQIWKMSKNLMLIKRIVIIFLNKNIIKNNKCFKKVVRILI